MQTYLLVKQIHLACVSLSGLGFALRVGLMALGRPALGRRQRLAMHINDTLLLSAGIGLALMGGHYPFSETWLTAKFFALIVYIVLGSLAMQATLAWSSRMAAGIGALGVFAYLVSVALSRNPLGPLALIAGGG